MDSLFQELAKLSPTSMAFLGALASAIGGITAAIVTGILGKIIVTPFLSARDKQDKETEWRKHAVELTKLDLERRLKTRAEKDNSRIRPSILDFLANYRDLQELGTKSPKDLYKEINEKRISKIENFSQSQPFTLSNKAIFGGIIILLIIDVLTRPRT